MTQPDVYFSCDVEADGPVPGPYSMLSYGLAVAGTFGERFSRAAPGSPTLYSELRPISDRFDPAALRVSGLDRDSMAVRGEEPAASMLRCHEWVLETAAAGRPVFIGYPAHFDWMFMQYYFVRFCEAGSPFRFNSVLDVKSMYAARARVPVSRANRRDMPAELVPPQPPAHHALADAQAQAVLFANIVEWDVGVAG